MGAEMSDGDNEQKENKTTNDFQKLLDKIQIELDPNKMEKSLSSRVVK